MHIYANGLGPTSWGKLNYVLPFRERFQIPAEKHDLSYCLGITEIDKEEADEQFLKGCLGASGKNLLAIFFSILYFILVSLFGNFFFNYEYNERGCTTSARSE